MSNLLQKTHKHYLVLQAGLRVDIAAALQLQLHGLWHGGRGEEAGGCT